MPARATRSVRSPARSRPRYSTWSIQHLADRIDRKELGHVLIAGHSGAYRGLACCADHGGLDNKLTGVCLLDSSYGNLDMFVNWVKQHPKGRFFSIFTDHLSAQNVGGQGRAQSYQRLEFLGDRVLGVVIAGRLYQAFPKASEGELSARG